MNPIIIPILLAALARLASAQFWPNSTIDPTLNYTYNYNNYTTGTRFWGISLWEPSCPSNTFRCTGYNFQRCVNNAWVQYRCPASTLCQPAGSSGIRCMTLGNPIRRSISCRRGYYLYNGRCVLHSPGCRGCVAFIPSVCTSCVKGYYLPGLSRWKVSLWNRACTRCPVGCNACLSNSVCTECELGYSFSYHGCVRDSTSTIPPAPPTGWSFPLNVWSPPPTEFPPPPTELPPPPPTVLPPPPTELPPPPPPPTEFPPFPPFPPLPTEFPPPITVFPPPPMFPGPICSDCNCRYGFNSFAYTFPNGCSEPACSATVNAEACGCPVDAGSLNTTCPGLIAECETMRSPVVTCRLRLLTYADGGKITISRNVGSGYNAVSSSDGLSWALAYSWNKAASAWYRVTPRCAATPACPDGGCTNTCQYNIPTMDSNSLQCSGNGCAFTTTVSGSCSCNSANSFPICPPLGIQCTRHNDIQSASCSFRASHDSGSYWGVEVNAHYSNQTGDAIEVLTSVYNKVRDAFRTASPRCLSA